MGGEPVMDRSTRREQERVAEAVAFAEVLVPALSGHCLPGAGAAKPAAPAPRRAAKPRGTNRGIADFIDEMLAQERAAKR